LYNTYFTYDSSNDTLLTDGNDNNFHLTKAFMQSVSLVSLEKFWLQISA